MFKRLKNKVIAAILAATITAVFTTASASAADITPRISQYYLAEGVGSVEYYITSGASSISTLIGNAANSWVYTGYGYNPIYMYQTTNFSASNIDIYKMNEGVAAGYTAATAYVDVTVNGHVSVDPLYGVWDYCEVFINDHFFDDLADVTKQGVIAHEMGHVFGLDHNNDNIYSIMCQLGYGRVVYKPGLADHYGINAMY